MYKISEEFEKIRDIRTLTFGEYNGYAWKPRPMLADLDFYKFTMCQVTDSMLPTTTQQMKFHNRTEGVDLAKYRGDVEHKLQLLCESKFKTHELEYLSRIDYITPGFLDFLRLLQLNMKHVSKLEANGTDLEIRTEGPSRLTTWFETHVMGFVQELYFNDVHKDLPMKDGVERLKEKVAKYFELSKQYKFTFSEFGTRRRASFKWQDFVINRLIDKFGLDSPCFIGTSNVHFAAKYKLPVSGTMAHEFLQMGQALDNVTLDQSQKYMLELWHKVYRARLGIALSDVVGTDAFIRDFDYMLASLYAGVRHDSGDPFVWAERHILNYERLGIDPKTKVLLFSDGLNVNKCEELLKAFHGKAKLSFGIGTDFTNDLGVKPLQLVMKSVQVNGRPVAKISDSPGKGMCEDENHEAAVLRAFRIGE